jgi:hypothetical protein
MIRKCQGSFEGRRKSEETQPNLKAANNFQFREMNALVGKDESFGTLSCSILALPGDHHEIFCG